MPDLLISLQVSLQSSFQELLQGVFQFVPRLALAIIVFVLGWIVAVVLAKLIADVLRRVRFNQVFDRGNWKQALEKADVTVDPSGFVGGIIKWVLVIVTLLIAVDLLGLTQLRTFVDGVLSYLPNVVAAALIFVVAVIVADIVEKVLRTAVESAQVGYGHLVGVIVRWSIWIFAILAILIQLGVAPVLLQTLFTGIVALVVLAGGISFGLGGKDAAAELLQNLVRKLRG